MNFHMIFTGLVRVLITVVLVDVVFCSSQPCALPLESYSCSVVSISSHSHSTRLALGYIEWKQWFIAFSADENGNVLDVERQKMAMAVGECKMRKPNELAREKSPRKHWNAVGYLWRWQEMKSAEKKYVHKKKSLKMRNNDEWDHWRKITIVTSMWWNCGSIEKTLPQTDKVCVVFDRSLDVKCVRRL